MTWTPQQADAALQTAAKRVNLDALYSIVASRARQDSAVFAGFVLRDEEDGSRVELTDQHVAVHRAMDAHKRLLVWSHVEAGKCEVAGSRVLLADGRWADIETLTEPCVVQVLDPDTFCLRTAPAGPVEYNGVKPVVRVELRSGRVLRLTHEHPLLTPTGWVEAARLQPGEHLATARRTGGSSGAEGSASPDEAALMGYLIGDGTCGLKGKVIFTNVDEAVLDRVRSLCAGRGWKLIRPPAWDISYCMTRVDLRTDQATAPTRWVRANGFACGSADKRVPARVMEASDAAVAAFIGAYFDCDGHVPKRATGGLEFSSTSRGLLEDVQLLLLRFGVASRLRYHHDRGESSAWRLMVSGEEDVWAFAVNIPLCGAKDAALRGRAIPRALSATLDVVPCAWRGAFHRELTAGDGTRYAMGIRPGGGNHRTVVRRVLADEPNAAVERLCAEGVRWDRVERVVQEVAQPTYALPVHDPAHCYLSSGVVSHNTNLALARMLWRLGRQPTMRWGVCSNTRGQAAKIVNAAARYIERSDALHAVFPTLTPSLSPSDPWADGFVTVERGASAIRDPSIQAFGAHGNVLGSRLDGLLIDDLLDYENTRTPYQREELARWFKATLLGRLTRDAEVIFNGNAFHVSDLMHQLEREGWPAVRAPVRDPDTGRSTWPARWPEDRIEEKIRELGPVEAARMLFCRASSDAEARFDSRLLATAMARGEGKTLTHSLTHLPPGVWTYTGVDLAVKRHARADLTSLFTIAVWEDGTREILNIESGRWTGPEIVHRIHDTQRRYQSQAGVEDNAAQEFLIQFAQAGGMGNRPIVPFHTGLNKHAPDYGVESLWVEVARGQWVIPNEGGNMHPEVRAWVDELLYYDPNLHAGDRLMASWIARETARRGTQKAETYRNVSFTSR